MHRSTAAPKDSSRELVADKVFVETDFFSDTPEKPRKGADPCRSECRGRDAKSVGSGPRTCLPDRGTNNNTEIRSSGIDSGKSSGICFFSVPRRYL
jgi:hypothetical protein